MFSYNLYNQNQGPSQKTQTFNESGLGQFLDSFIMWQIPKHLQRHKHSCFWSLQRNHMLVEKIDYSDFVWAFICSQNRGINWVSWQVNPGKFKLLLKSTEEFEEERVCYPCLNKTYCSFNLSFGTHFTYLHGIYIFYNSFMN